jgi:Bacterial Ig domain
MKRYTKIRINKITLFLTIGLLIFVISSNSIYAQQVLPGTTVVPSKAPNTAVPPKIHAVKITSPAKGQQVPIGNNLVVSGTSSDDSNSNCQVSVIVNGIKPYQPATASGAGGANDYSKWGFTLSPKYTAIKEGENKIIALLASQKDSQ